MWEVKMKLVISYNDEAKKVMIKIGENKEKEMSFEELLAITNDVVDNNVNYIIDISGFDENPDVGENYRKIIEDIINLKNDPEIIDLKSKSEKDNSLNSKIETSSDNNEDPFSNF